MVKSHLFALAISGLLMGCGDTTAPPGSSEQGSSIRQVTANQQLSQIYNQYFDEYLALNPLRATAIGHHEYNDQLPNFLSPEYRQRVLRFEQRYLDKVAQLEPSSLTESQLVSYKIFKREREMAIRGNAFPSHLIPINQFYNIANRFAMLGSGTSAQPFKTAKDYRDWAERMSRIPLLFQQAQDNMRSGIDKGIVQPRVLIDKAIAQIAAHLVTDVEESLFWTPLSRLPDGISDKQKNQLKTRYRDVIKNQVLPAYQQLHDYLANEYLPHTRNESFGVGQLPQGKSWYQYLIEANTSTTLSADRIHRIGKSEVARLHGEMRDIMSEVGFQGNLEAFFDFMTSDPQFVYSSSDVMLADYRALRSKVDERIPQLFEQLPQADYQIRQVEPFRQQSASSGSYQSAPSDSSKTATFYLNTYDLASRPTWAKTALFLHEAVPGHHFQISIQQQLDDLPRFRKFGRHTVYTEGWALYAESLGDDLGLYQQSPYQRFGALAAELWHSIRLVSDTGIHDRGWSRQRVLDYMQNNAPITHTRAVAEAERIMALPGQALAYKIGQLKIAELRRLAENKLGNKFDIKAFHRVVLDGGAVPLIILEQKVRRWIVDLRS